MIQVAGLAVVAALAGSAAMSLAGSRLLDVDPVARSEPDPVDEEDEVPTPSPPVAARPSAASDILARNVFCPGCVPGEGAPASAALLADAPVAMPANLPLRLMATMESDDPRGSIATLYHADRGTTGVYGPGDTVLAGMTLLAVGPGTVTIGAGGSTQLLRVGQAPRPAPKPVVAPAKPKAAKPKKATSSIPGADEAISCTGNTCEVERDFVESLLRNPASLATQAAVRPTANGFALARVRRGTLPHLLGLRTGDVLTEVNGDALDSIDKAIGLATKLRHASNLSVTVLRKGKRIDKEIRIS